MTGWELLVKVIDCNMHGETLKLIATLLLVVVVFSPWAGLGRDQSSVRRLVWLWYAASWASS